MSRDPVMAFNFGPITDDTPQIPFIDIARNMRRFVWNSFSNQIAAGDLDVNGYPPAIIDGQTKIQTIWAKNVDDTVSYYPGENYVFTYDGEGTFTFSGTSTVSSEAGRHVFTMPSSPQNVVLSITETDPNATGEYLRNFSLVPAKFEELHNLGEIFNPDWLALIDNARLFRIGAWTRWSDSTITDWADMPPASYATYIGVARMPLATMVAFANQVGADPWFVLPYSATDAYVTQFATYVQANLNSGLVAHYELANETWNRFYTEVYNYMNSQGVSLFASGDTFQDGQRWYGYRAAQMMEVIRGVYNEDSGAGNWVGVLGTQNANTDVTNKRLDGVTYHIENDVGVPVGTAINDLFSIVAGTTYFGASTMTNTTLRNELLAYIAAHTQQETFTWYKGKLLDSDYSSSIPQIVAQWSAQKTVANADGLDFHAYEGGQHVHHSAGVSIPQNDLDTLTTFMRAFVRSSEMADLYQELWDQWESAGEGPFMQYSDVGFSSSTGSWGLYNSLTDSNPRASLVQSLAQSATKWFTDIVGRTSLPDPRKVLAFIGGGKHRAEVGDNGCTIDGDASGETAVIMPGAPADYTCARDGTDTALYTYTHTSSGKEYKQRNCQAVGWSG